MRIVRRIRRIIEWLPVLWRDEDWDFAYLVRITQFKLRRMADCIESNQISVCCEKKAKQMRVVAAHFDRFLDHPYWKLDHSDLWVIGPNERGKFKRYFNDKYIFPYQQDKQIMDLEQWHWNEAWRKIAKYGREWWD